MIAPIPANEPARLAAVHACGVLDTAPEQAFDDVARLASHMCGTPIAAVGFIDESRQWFKAKVGLQLDEEPRAESFCAHTILSDEPLIVPDLKQDTRFRSHPMVEGEPYIRFYAGVPLVLEKGIAVGTLAVVDMVPRELTAGQVDALRLLAGRVVTELNLRREIAALSSTRPVLASGSARSAVSAPNGGDVPASGVRPTAHALESPVAMGSLLDERYRIESSLGVGGMGLVVRAHDLQHNRPVAIKFMRPDAAARPDALRRFVREAQALMRLKSEHVAQLLDVGNLSNGAPYIVMELLEGEDLARRLERCGRWPAAGAVALVLELCRATEAAHAHGILHRDLKPSNLFLSRTADGAEVLKVLDFGVSKLAGVELSRADTALTGTTSLLGSPLYMSPEQMTHPNDVDARTDIWSIGAVLYHMLSGSPPHVGDSIPEIYAKALNAPVVPLARRRSELPESLCQVVDRCLAREREERFDSVEALATALRRAVLDETTRSALPRP